MENNFSSNVFIRAKKRHEKKQKEKQLRSLFIKNLMLRTTSKPTSRKNKTIEMARRILQLILLLYKRPVKNETIKNLLRVCYRKRSIIAKLYMDLEKANIRQDRFIIFCFWYLNQFPATIHRAFTWIIKGGITTLQKYESAERDLWPQVYELAESMQRGKKLIRLVRVMQDELSTDEAYDRLKKI